MDEKNLLQARIRELGERCRMADIPTHTNFLTIGEQSANGFGHENTGTREGVPYVLAGGFPEAERRVVCFLPDYLSPEDFSEDDVIACIETKVQGEKFAGKLTHRDYLGALMGLGIEREMAGDILVTENGACLFVMQELGAYVEEKLREVGRERVEARIIPCGQCSIRPKSEVIEGSTASARLDAVTAFVFRLSRQDAKELIDREQVFVDGEVRRASYELKEGERVSVRGYGKFVYEGVLGTTKKGRERTRVRRFV